MERKKAPEVLSRAPAMQMASPLHDVIWFTQKSKPLFDVLLVDEEVGVVDCNRRVRARSQA